MDANAQPLIAAESPLVVTDVVIRRDAAGRYCINDLHRAAGGQSKHQPAFWLRNGSTQALVGELGASANSQTPVATLNDGANNGTYVAKELVYAYAMWISPSFHLRVIRAYDSMVTTLRPAAVVLPNFTDPADAAIAWAEQFRARQQAEIARRQAEAIAHDRAAQLEAAAPAVRFHNDVAKAINGQTVAEVAKVIGTGPVRLFAWLREKKLLMSNNIPYQDYIDRGYFKLVEKRRNDLRGEVQTYTQTLVTGKGLEYIHEKWSGMKKLA